MNCPACDVACASETYEGVNIDVCTKCKGVWLDKNELEVVSRQREKGYKANDVEAINRLCGVSGTAKETDSREMKCPKCGDGSMKTLNYAYSSGIFIDRCSKGCGLWLDADELEKVQMHSELWQDKLEANRNRFASLARQVDDNVRATIDQIENATAPSRFRFVNSILRGLIRIS